MKLSIYDFDGTYMRNEILRKAYKFWKQQKLNKRMYRKIWNRILFRNLLYRLGLFGWTKPKFRANAMSLTADLFRSISRTDLGTYLTNLYEYLQPFVNQSLKEQLLIDKANGYYTVLLSGNFDIILKPFLSEGFDEVIGTVVEKGNELLPSDEVKIIIHDLKASTIKERFPDADFENSKAYADSYYDLPILELVGYPTAFNPDDELRKIALDRGYRILEGTKKEE